MKRWFTVAPLAASPPSKKRCMAKFGSGTGRDGSYFTFRRQK